MVLYLYSCFVRSYRKTIKKALLISKQQKFLTAVMEKLPGDVKFGYNEDTLEVVRKAFGLEKPGEMNNAVDVLEEWVKQQNHFTKKNFDRRYLETTIIISKGSLEKAKTRLDRACTFRTCMSQFFDEIFDIKHIFATDLKDVKQAWMPKLTKDHERVVFLRNVGQYFEPTLLLNYTRILPVYAEYVRLYDYAITNSVVIDYTEVNLIELVKALSINGFREMAALLLDGYGFRLKALYIISANKLVDMVATIFKHAMGAKLSSRLHVLKDKDEIKNFFDKDILPKEYGGNEKSLNELHDEILDELTSEKYVKYLKEIFEARTDESLRQKDVFNDQYMGMPGSFRTLNVD